jgi:hypothetical protein
MPPPARHSHQVRDGADGLPPGHVADAAAEVLLESVRKAL